MSFLVRNAEKAKKSIYVEVPDLHKPFFKSCPKNNLFKYFQNFGQITSLSIKHSYAIIEFNEISSVDSVFENAEGHVVQSALPPFGQIGLKLKRREVKCRSKPEGSVNLNFQNSEFYFQGVNDLDNIDGQMEKIRGNYLAEKDGKNDIYTQSHKTCEFLKRTCLKFLDFQTQTTTTSPSTKSTMSDSGMEEEKENFENAVINVLPFGSLSLGLASGASDIDLTILINEENCKVSIKSEYLDLYKLYTTEYKNDQVENYQENLQSKIYFALKTEINSKILKLSSARTPIFRFKFYGKQIDVSVNNYLALEKTNLQKEFLDHDMDSKRRDLIILVLAWLKNNDLISTGNRQARINSYAIICLIIKLSKEFVISYDTTLLTHFQSFVNCFLDYFIDIQSEAGKILFYDPVETDHNITQNVNEQFLNLLVREFKGLFSDLLFFDFVFFCIYISLVNVFSRS